MLPKGIADVTFSGSYDDWYEQVAIAFAPNIVVLAGFQLSGGYQIGTVVIRAFDVSGAVPVALGSVSVSAGTDYPQGYHMAGVRIDADRGMVMWADGRTPRAVAFQVSASGITVGARVVLDYAPDEGTAQHGRIFPLNHGDSALPYGLIEPSPGGMGLGVLTDGTVVLDAVGRWYPPGPAAPNLNNFSIYYRFAGVKLTVTGLVIAVGDWYWLENGEPYYITGGGTLQYYDGQTTASVGNVIHQVVTRLPYSTSHQELRSTDWSTTPPVQSHVPIYTGGDGVMALVNNAFVVATDSTFGTQVITPTVTARRGFDGNIGCVPVTSNPNLVMKAYFDGQVPAADYVIEVDATTGVVKDGRGEIDLSGHGALSLNGVSVFMVGIYAVTYAEWQNNASMNRQKTSRLQVWSLAPPGPPPDPILRPGPGVSQAYFV